MRRAVSAGHGLLLLLLPAFSLPDAGRAQSPAGRLSEYQSVLRVSAVAGVTAKSFSGAAFHPGTRTLYVIDNDNAIIYELDTAGVLKRTLATSGITDPEGIAYESDDCFLITEEGLANIVRLKLPRTGAGPVGRSSGTVLNIGPNMANSGIEGVAYRAADKSAFAVKEIDPPRLYRIALDSAGIPVSSAADQPFDIGNKSGDAADIAAPDDGNFIVVDQELNRLEGYDAQGKPLSTLALGMTKPEGIAVDASTGTIYMVGEPAEFAVFKPKGTSRLGKPSAGGEGIGLSPVPGSTGGANALRLILDRPEWVRISFASPGGSSAPVFQGRLGPGSHVIPWGRSAPGVGFFRVATGSRASVVKTLGVTTLAR